METLTMDLNPHRSSIARRVREKGGAGLTTQIRLARMWRRVFQLVQHLVCAVCRRLVCFHLAALLAQFLQYPGRRTLVFLVCRTVARPMVTDCSTVSLLSMGRDEAADPEKSSRWACLPSVTHVLAVVRFVGRKIPRGEAGEVSNKAPRGHFE